MKKMRTYAFLSSKSFMFQEVQGKNLYDAWKKFENIFMENMSKDPYYIDAFGVPDSIYAVGRNGAFGNWKTSFDKHFIKRATRFVQQLRLVRKLDKAINQGGEL